MTKTSEDFVTKVLLFIKKAKQGNRTQLYISNGIKCLIDTLNFVTPKQKNELYRRFMYIVRNDGTDHGYRMLFKTMNKVERKRMTTAKITVLQDKMDDARKGRVSARHTDTAHGARFTGGAVFNAPIVFYLCSVHTGPAEDHKEWQGKIYVDRYWRSVLEKHGGTDTGTVHGDLIKGIGAYIKNHNILTVQEVVNHKPYLITRPYCRHFFIPLSTEEVLGSSLNKILKEHPEAHTKSKKKPRSKTRKQYKRISNLLS